MRNVLRGGSVALVSVATFCLLGTTACKKQKAGADAGNCTYTYDNTTSKVGWKAFKFTNRVGVGGTFGRVTARGGNPGAKTAGNAVTGIEFSVLTSTVDSKLAPRDKKIAEQFFGILVDKGVITGTVKRASGGKGIIALTFNGITRDVPATYVLNGAVLTVTGKVDVNDFKAGKAVVSLNKVCTGGHTGEDKVSKLWPDAEFTVTTTLNRQCKQ